MTTGNADHSQGERGGGGGNDLPPLPATPSPALFGGNNVYKSGPLYLSSKGIGWTSWKKRWFILTQTSLVFFRSDPNAPTQKGSEVNLTLGGIDLNSSGSVVVKEDKKLLTVLFPDGRDGRAFTLKAETMDDLHEWKIALDEALSNAPAAVAIGQNGMLKKDQCNAIDVSSDQCLLKDRPVKSLVIGGPILLALEDIDGTPSFLEKGLRFVEEHGVKVEGILRQAADVDDVEYRIREYEKGKNEFSPQEDPHVIADCVKYVLRELPSSPVPASCCKALLEAFRTDRGTRVNSMRTAICETFPEPNRRLLQRILMMMQTVASHKAVNRMSTSAVAACMAPLLLRPLLAGDCELENDFDVGGDGSIQLLQAAAAANHAQAIVITLLDEYENIFGEGSATPEPYTDSEESETESGEEITDDDDDDSSLDNDGGEEEATEESDVDADENLEQLPTATSSGTDEFEYKVPRSQNSGSESPEIDDISKRSNSLPSSPLQTSLYQHVSVQGSHDIPNEFSDDAKKEKNDWSELFGSKKSSSGPLRSPRRPTIWGRTPAKRSLSMESIDLPSDDEAEIEKLESAKIDLQERIATEAKMNSLLVDDLQKRKHELQERHLALTRDVEKLQEQLQKEIELRVALEAAARTSQLPQFVSSIVDEKVKADLEEIAQAEMDVLNLKQKTDDMALQLNRQRDQNSKFSQNPNLQKSSKEKQVEGGVIAISTTPEIGSRSKGTNATGSALSKLTNRLNFLKERRSQIASELQNLDKNRNSSQSVQNLEQQKTGGSQQYQEPKWEKTGQSENYESLHNDPDGPRSLNLDRGKSESFPVVDKSRSKNPPRTYSR